MLLETYQKKADVNILTLESAIEVEVLLTAKKGILIGLLTLNMFAFRSGRIAYNWKDKKYSIGF